MAFPQGTIRQQEQHAVAAIAGTTEGSLHYVNSVNGNDGNNGDSFRRPLKTLTRALAKAVAGDTVILAPGGKETVTATIAANLARVRIICPTNNPEQGFNIDGVGTLNLLTVSAADVTISGLKFTRTGATSDQACIITTAAADRLHVENCVFDDNAITTTFTGVGVEVTDDAIDGVVKGCTFRDCQFGVAFIIATGKDCDRWHITGCLFFVGQAASFGIDTALTGSGTVRGPVVSNCVFLEADGDGTAATGAWDGADGDDATKGPIQFAAAVDQFIIENCRAFTVLSRGFVNIIKVASGAVGDIVRCSTGKREDVAAGSFVIIKKTLTSSDIDQTPGVDVTGVSVGGELICRDIVIQSDATGLAGMTNLQLTVDNAKGMAAPFETIATGIGGAAETIDQASASVTGKHFVLEQGKKVTAKATAADGTGAGTIDVTMIFQRAVDGADIAAA